MIRYEIGKTGTVFHHAYTGINARGNTGAYYYSEKKPLHEISGDEKLYDIHYEGFVEEGEKVGLMIVGQAVLSMIHMHDSDFRIGLGEGIPVVLEEKSI